MRLKAKVRKSNPAKRESKSLIAQKELAQQLTECPDEELVAHLKNVVEWTFGEGDIYTWANVLNRFDDILSKLHEYYEPQTTLDLPILKSSFPRELVLQVLRVTCLILENAFNRFLYGSAEHLGDLLRIDDVEIVLATLRLLSILVKKTRSRVTTRIHGDPVLNAQLFYLTKGWGGKQDGLGLLYCVQDKDVTPKLSIGTTLQFEFFVDAKDSKQPTEPEASQLTMESSSKEEDAMDVESVVTKVEGSDEKQEAAHKESEPAGVGKRAVRAGHRSIQYPCFHLFTESNIDILSQLVEKYSIPRKYHFPLLMRIRLARSFPDASARRDLVRINLLAFTVLAQAHMDLGTLSSFFLYEPEFIAELMELVKSDRNTPQDFRILVLDALSALTTDRSRLPKVIAVTGSSQHHGELPSMVRKAVATLTGSVEHPIFTLPFIDSLFSFLSALMATPDGVAALNTAGIISTLLPLLRHQNPEHSSLLLQCLSILEFYVAGSNSAAAISLFRDLGGLDLLIERFNTEISSAKKVRSEQETGGMSAELITEADAQDKGKEKVESDSSQGAGDDLQDDEEEDSQLPHHQRSLMKTILRILHPFIQGGGRRNIGRLTGVIEGPFPRSLCYVLEHYPYFGERIFSLALSIMSGLINNDPTRYTALSEAGLPSAFLSFITQGIEPSSSVICALPTAISSLCLNPAGLAAVVDSNVLGALMSLFTDPKYRKVIRSGDTASRLGAGVDELLRHHPALRPIGIKAIIASLRRVCKMGGVALSDAEASDVSGESKVEEEDRSEPTTPNASSNSSHMAVEGSTSGGVAESSTSAEVSEVNVSPAPEATTQQPTEMMELSPEAPAGEEQTDGIEQSKVKPFVEPDLESDVDPSLVSEYIGNLGRFLETIFTNSEHGRHFIDAHGMNLMFQLQSLPELPPTFPGSNAAHSLTLAFRSLAAHHTPDLFRGVLDSLASKFDDLDQLMPSWRDGASFVGAAEGNAKLVGVLASIDCFAALLSGLVRDPNGLTRSTSTSLSEWISDSGNKVSTSLAHLQRCILWEIAREAYVERKKPTSTPEESSPQEARPITAEHAESAPTVETAETEGNQQSDSATSTSADAVDSPASTTPAEAKPGKKENKQLLTHLVSSIHSVSQGLAKALGARHRSRDEKVVHTLAQTLVRALQEHLVWVPKSYTDDDPEAGAPVKCAYLASVVGELRSFFFNERHNNTHTLLLHQFNFIDGVTTFLKTLEWVVDVYAHLRKKEVEGEALKEPMETSAEKGKEKAPSETSGEGDLTLSAIIKEKSESASEEPENRDPDTDMAEGALLTFGTVLKFIVCGPMVASSPITANMMTQTLPGQQGPFDPHIFLGGIQSRVLLAVFPIWNHPLFAHFPQRFITSLIHANRYIMEGEAAAAAAVAAASGKKSQPAKPKKQFEPDPGVVTQLVEMGFSQRRAEDALRSIGANNVELAMDWIFSNPESEPEPAPAVMPPASAASAPAAPSDEMAEAMTEDEELAAALAMSLGQSIQLAPPPVSAPDSISPPSSQESPAAEASKQPDEPPKKEEPVDYTAQYDMLRKGMLERCVRLLIEVDNLTHTVVDVLSSICKKPDDKSGSSSTKSDERAHVVTALADQIKLTAAERPPTKALYRLTHALTLLMTDNMALRELVAKSGVVPVLLELLNLMFADPEVSRLSQEEHAEGPKWLTTALLILYTLCQLPAALPSVSDTSSSEKNDVDAKMDGMESDEANAFLPLQEVPYLLSLEDRRQALEVCVKLLTRALRPEVMQAVLQLSAHLTRDYNLAQQFIHQGGLTELMTIPTTSGFSGQVGIITTILRHLIEEPGLLQHAMESEIKSTITKLMGRSGALVKPRNFLSTVAPLVCRDPVTFLRASANVVRLRDPKSSVAPARVVLMLANSAAHTGSKGKTAQPSGLPSSSAKADKAELSSSGKPKTKRTPSTAVQVITELTNALLTISRIKAAVDKTKTAPVGTKGKEKADSGQVESTSMDTTAESGDQSDLMSITKKPTLSSGDILQILTDFITTYPPCGSVLLRQQLKKPGNKGKSKGKDKQDDKRVKQPHEVNNIISYILGELLPYSGGGSEAAPADRQKQNAAAANMLAALAQKPDGRRRIIDEITQAMKRVIAERENSPNYSEVIQALVDFLFLLLTSSASRGHSSGFLGDVARLMLEVDTIKTLTAALKSADLNHPDAPQLVNTILKPLEILTRLTAVMSAKSAQKKVSDVSIGEATSNVAPSAAASVSEGTDRTELAGAGESTQEGADTEASDRGDTSMEVGQLQLSELSGAGHDMEETHSLDENDLQGQVGESVHALTAEERQILAHGNLSSVVNLTLNFLEAATEAMRSRSASEMDEDMSSSGSDSSDSEESEDEHDEEGSAPLHHHHHPEDEVDEDEEEDEEDEGGEEEEEEEEESSDEEEAEEAYSYEEPEAGQQEWSQDDFDFSIQLGGSGANLPNRPAWALNVEDLLISGAPQQDTRGGLPRAVPPANPFLAETIEATHPLLNIRTGGNGVPVEMSGPDAPYYPLPPTLRGNPVVEEEVRRLFGRVRAQRGGRPIVGHWSEDAHQQRATPGMTEFAASIEPLFVETIRRVTLQELKEREDAERAEREKAESERVQIDDGASKTTEELSVPATEHVSVPDPLTAEATVPAVESTPVETPAPVPLAETTPVDTPSVVTSERETSAPQEVPAQPSQEAPAVTEAAVPLEAATPAETTPETQPTAEDSQPTPAQPATEQPAAVSGGEETSLQPAQPDQPAAAVEDVPGIDPAFLAALPEDLRAEILAEQLQARAAFRPPQPAAASSPSAAPATVASASESSSSSSESPSAAAPAVSTTSISPDFIAALPPEIQAEVLQQEQSRAAAPVATDVTRAQAMSTADFFATLSPELREEILLTQDESSLPPELAAEASALRERAFRQYQQYSNRRREWGGPTWAEPAQRRTVVEPPTGLSTSTGRSKIAKSTDIQPAEVDGRPIIEVSDLVHLVRLLYLAKPLAKGLLHRLFLNLSSHKESRMQLLNIMMTILNAFNALPTSSSSSTFQERRFASFAEALEALPAITPSSDFSPLEDPCHSLLSAGTMNTYVHSGQHPPSLVARRVLEILSHLLKNNSRIASFMLGIKAEASASEQDKGKEKESTELTTTTSSTTSSSDSVWCPLAKLMDLLGVDQFRNSSAQLDQLLQVLALSVQPLAKLKAREERRKRELEEREARERAERERREREERIRLEREAMAVDEAALAAVVAATTEATEPAAPAEPTSTTATTAPTTMEVEGAAPASEPAETTPSIATRPVQIETTQQPVAETPVTTSMEVEASPAAPAATEEKKEEPPKEETAEEICPQVPMDDLRNLVSVLTLENCSEGTYKNATHVLQQLSANSANRDVLFKQLINAAQDLAEVVVNGLEGLCEELAGSFHPTLILSMASSTAELNLLRIIKTVMALPATATQSTDDFIDSLRLEPLWDALERCLDIITELMEKDAAAKGKGKNAKGKERSSEGPKEGDGSKSPAANLLLPIIEVFFVVNAKDPGPLKRSASVIDFGLPGPGFVRSASSSSLRPSMSRENITLARTMSRSSSLYGLSEQSRFAMFAEKHRVLLNDLVRQNPSLLHGTFKILLKYPRVLDFDNKRAWFRHQLQKLKDTRGYYGGVRLRVNRARVFEDSYRIMSGRSPEELRGRMTVQFQGEEGIDAGGLTREWYDILAKEIFNADYALFINTAQDNSTFQPNRFSYYNHNHLDYFKFVGRVIGKAILDGYFLPCHFTRSFYKHILGITVQPSDMEAIDPEYYKNLRWILENDPTPLDLTFSTEVDEFGEMKVVDLKEDGKNIPVTNENKHEYVQLVTEMRMTTSIKSQIDAFLEGFHDLIPKELISVFNEMELELLISGLPEIDLEDLRANTLYTGYTENSPVIQWFWKTLNSFGQEERAKLLQFVTGTSRVPLDGFKSLRGISGPQKFQIHKSYRKDQLPAAHTCFNQLDLPEYETYERLREALMYAIRETEGFGFG